MSDTSFDYDVLVIGSGFGGSVAALRLSEKGYRVGVLEAGRRFSDDEFAKTSWHVREYLWAPALRCFGITRMTLLKNTFVTAGAGVGGGSLVYATTLYRPLEPFFTDKQWAHITDWQAELEPHFDQAERMLGVTTAPFTESDAVLRDVAEDMGVAHTFQPTRIGVFLGQPGAAPGQESPDPYFGGVGPARRACIGCGQCVVGCRHNAKNHLGKNYLFLAENAGTEIHPLTTVTDVSPLPGGGYQVTTARTGAVVRRPRRRFTAEQVVFAAAALGTQKLLHRLRDTGSLPHISPRLGELTRTNSEAVLYPLSLRKGADYSKGPSITSSIHPDPVTHVEVGRLGGKGSNALSLMTTVLADPSPRWPRWLMGLHQMLKNWRHVIAIHNPRHWSERTLGLLVMQTSDNSLTTYTRRGLMGRRMTTKPGDGSKPPAWIPPGHEVARRVADKIGGVAKGSVFDLFNIPSTGHFLGGCPIGDSPTTGVVDPYLRMHGYSGLHVVDGSTISANLGANPSLTITAQAERAMSLWPNRGEEDPRPPLGSAYRRLAGVAPRSPAVPPTAPAALRWASGEASARGVSQTRAD